MRTALIGLLAAVTLAGFAACSFPSFTGNDAASESSTPDINATVSAAVAKAIAEQAGSTEAVSPTRLTVTPVSNTGQTSWLDGLAQFRRIKIARDAVHCIGYDNGRYYAGSHTIIRIDDGFYALGNPGEAVAFWDDDTGCRIGVITDESME